MREIIYVMYYRTKKHAYTEKKARGLKRVANDKGQQKLRSLAATNSEKVTFFYFFDTLMS